MTRFERRKQSGGARRDGIARARTNSVPPIAPAQTIDDDETAGESSHLAAAEFPRSGRSSARPDATSTRNVVPTPSNTALLSPGEKPHGPAFRAVRSAPARTSRQA